MVSRPTHFEIYGNEPGKLAEFYGRLFGWSMERVEGLDYWRIRFQQDDPGNVAGGITTRPRVDPRGWLQFVNVDSVDDAIATAEQAGATVIRPKTAIPRTAWVAVLADPAGNHFAIWQPDSLAFPMPEPD